MVIINNKMFHILLEQNSKVRLSSKLKRLLTQGFINKHGCYFVKSLYILQKHVTGHDFIDKTQYECFINSINIDDYESEKLLNQSVLLIKEIEKKWKQFSSKLPLTIILGKTKYGFNLKFHLTRIGQEWVNTDELESFCEALLVYKI